jgi:hypothetical protein
MKTFKIIFYVLACLVIASNVEACDQGSQPSIASSVGDTLVGQLKLISPSPNPSRGATIVGFTNSQKVMYSFYVIDVHGDTVYTMASNQIAEPGSHSFTIPAGKLIPGTYLYTLQAGSMVLRKKLSVVE